MAFWSDFSKGVSTHIRAWEFVAQHKLWAYFLYPVVLLIILSLAGFYSVWTLSSHFADAIFDYITPDIDTGTGWLDSTLWVLYGIAKFAAGFMIKLYLFSFFMKLLRYVTLLLCSPMMALLSERVDEILTGRKYPFVMSQFMKDVLRGMLVSLRNLFFEISIMLLCCLVMWIPVIGWFTAPFLMIISWYFLGFNMMDYTCERRRLPISQGAKFIRKYKGIAIGNGMVFSFLLMIPWIGLVIAPVLSSVAGTLATMEKMAELQRPQNQWNG
jgi:CysZ protein